MCLATLGCLFYQGCLCAAGALRLMLLQVEGKPERPRLAVYRSNNNIYVQVCLASCHKLKAHLSLEVCRQQLPLLNTAAPEA